jgi:hypothetical protein
MEEVIIYRFDHMSLLIQMFLKFASVVSANGAPFTVSTLAYMMQDESAGES